MPSFDVKKYKIDKTPISSLLRLNDKHLAAVLNEWSRIGNARARRMKKKYPMYTGVQVYIRGGSFGKSGTYKNRTTMTNELQRIKQVAPTLKEKTIKTEEKELDDIMKSYVKEASPTSSEGKGGYDPEQERIFRAAFISFARKQGVVNYAHYNEIKSIVTNNYANRGVTFAEEKIKELYDQFEEMAKETHSNDFNFLNDNYFGADDLEDIDYTQLDKL